MHSIEAAADAVERELADLRAKLAVAVDDAEKWKRAFSAQSSKLQAVLDIPGVRETLSQIDRAAIEEAKKK